MTIQKMAMHGMIILLGATALQAATDSPEITKQHYQHSSQSTTTSVIRSGGSYGNSGQSTVNIANILSQYRIPVSQQAAVNIRSRDLNQPHRLTIGTTGNSVSGIVKVDGRSVHVLRSGNSSVELNPYLTTGQHTVEIVGAMPAASTVRIALNGPGTQVSHQLNGQGPLNYTLRISVQ